MFGYVVVNKQELKIKEFELYQSYYCGLCATLHHDYGRFAQIALNYDMTFLHMVLSGLYEPLEIIKKVRCVMHPISTHIEHTNELSTYAAEMTVVLMYLKCDDDWQDEHRFSALTMRQMLKGKYLEIYNKYPDKVKHIVQALTENAKCERLEMIDLDQLAKLSGQMLGEIFAYKNDEWRDTLYEMGDYLGRFIYLMDAYDDLVSDKKKGCFNPFLSYEQRDDFDDWVFDILEMMIAQCCDAFERLPIVLHVSILRNILYSGVWSKYETIRKKRLGE